MKSNFCCSVIDLTRLSTRCFSADVSECGPCALAPTADSINDAAITMTGDRKAAQRNVSCILPPKLIKLGRIANKRTTYALFLDSTLDGTSTPSVASEARIEIPTR